MSKTVEEIAKATGFSITTVRFVINGQSDKYRISAKTRQAVEDYIAIHGDSLNHTARSLKLNRSETIGFVVPDLANAYFARLMAALEARCNERNLLLLTLASHENPELENRAITSLLERGVDGLAIAPCQPTVLPQLRSNKMRASIVLFDRGYPASPFHTVVSDNYQGGLDMARRMLRESGGNCYFLCGHAESPSLQDRIRGFVAACEECGVVDPHALIWQDATDSPATGRHLMRLLIDDLSRPPAAFMCSSLLVLEGALLQLREQMGAIDPGLLIGTFDDHAMLDLLPNRIVSIRQNEAAIAERLFQRLIEPRDLDRLQGETDVVPCELICRNL